MIEVEVFKMSPTRYRALDADTGEELCVSETPLLSAARVLQARGVDAETIVIMTRNGKPQMQGSVGGLAALAVSENANHGPRFVKYRPWSDPVG